MRFSQSSIALVAWDVGEYNAGMTVHSVSEGLEWESLRAGGKGIIDFLKGREISYKEFSDVLPGFIQFTSEFAPVTDEIINDVAQLKAEGVLRIDINWYRPCMLQDLPMGGEELRRFAKLVRAPVDVFSGFTRQPDRPLVRIGHAVFHDRSD